MGKTCKHVLCPAWTEVCLHQVSSTPTAAMISAVGLGVGWCQPVSLPGHKTKTVRRENSWWCRWPHLKTVSHTQMPMCYHRFAHWALPRWCGLVGSAMRCFPSNTEDASPCHRKEMNGQIHDCHWPFLMHSRILLSKTSNHTSLTPGLHPAPNLQRTWNRKTTVNSALSPKSPASSLSDPFALTSVILFSSDTRQRGQRT